MNPWTIKSPSVGQQIIVKRICKKEPEFTDFRVVEVRRKYFNAVRADHKGPIENWDTLEFSLEDWNSSERSQRYFEAFESMEHFNHHVAYWEWRQKDSTRREELRHKIYLSPCSTDQLERIYAITQEPKP